MSRMTVPHRISGFLSKLGLRKRTPALNQALPDALPGAAAPSEG
jgi:hypothetical protein